MAATRRPSPRSRFFGNTRVSGTRGVLTRVAPVLAALTLLACAPHLLAQDNPERDRAQARLQSVLGEIAVLQEQLDASRREHRGEQARVRQLDLALQEANRKYRRLAEEREGHERELRALEKQREDYLAALDERTARLAEQVRSAYRAGHQSRMKLVLNQDDPTRIARMLAYYDYINQAQVAKIEDLRVTVATLEGMQQDIDTELQRITAVQQEQQLVLDELKRQRLQRAELLAALSGKIGSGEAQLRELEKNRADLQALVERLSDILADIPDDLGKDSGLQGNKGRLPMPVKGPVLHAFGQNRSGALSWQGWLIGAGTGTEVSSVAYGRVAFADWLRGYGLLMIIDHGEGFMSLYGHNESLLREPGAWVEPGDVISTVGSNPASSQGLYFELRKNGKAVDPAAWLAR